MRKFSNRILLVIVCVATIGCSSASPLRRGSTESDLADAERVLSIGRLTERRGEASKAQEIYEGLIANGKSPATANHRLGVMAAKNRDFDRAWKHFEAAAANGLDSSELFADMGYARLLAGEFAAAEEMFAKALKKTPSDKRSLNNMAILRGAQGRFSESLAFSQRAVGAAKAQANLGYLLSQFGDAEKAVQHYHIALNQDPSLKVAASALLQIEVAKPAEPSVMAIKPRAIERETAKLQPPMPVAETTVAVAKDQVKEEPGNTSQVPVVVVTEEAIEPKPMAPEPSPSLVEVEVAADFADETMDEGVEAFLAKVDLAETQKLVVASATEEVGVDETLAIAKIGASIPVKKEVTPRMSSRRRWSRAEFYGEARTISYLAEVTEPEIGFSLAHLPVVESTGIEP